MVLALNKGAWSSLASHRGAPHPGPSVSSGSVHPSWHMPHPSSLAHGLLYSTGQPQKSLLLLKCLFLQGSGLTPWVI